METVDHLHPHDLKILTAKAVCFRTVVRLEEKLFTNDQGSESLAIRSRVLSILSDLELFAAAKIKDSEIASFLEDLAKTLEYLLGLYIENPLIRDEFIRTFRDEATSYRSIRQDLESWLQAMLQYARHYFEDSPCSLPNIQLVLGAPELRDPPQTESLSAVTHWTESGRQITLFLRSDSMDFESFFQIPYLLSHEFWCHALSNICEGIEGSVPVPWRGCDPQDAWEEGWMDHVQRLILLASDFPMPPHHLPCLVSPLYRASSQYEHARSDPSNGIHRSYGWSAAVLSASFFRQYFAAFKPDELLLDFSVKLNILKCLPERKGKALAFFKNHLSPPEFGNDDALSSDRNMLERRNRLFRRIAPFIFVRSGTKAASIELIKFLSSLEN